MEKPYLVVEWNDTKTYAVGWLCVYNYVRGSTGGGTRMHPSVTKEEVVRLAHAMAYKYNAIGSKTMGGCKAGIAYDYKAPDAKEVLKRFLHATAPYTSYGVSIGADLGTNYDYILSVLADLGIGVPETPWMKNDPKIQQNIKDFNELLGKRYDGFLINDMITGYGVVYSLDEGWKCMKGKPGAKVVIQGFGCVGASASSLLHKMGYKVVGISDANIMAYNENGLDIPTMVADRKPFGEINQEKLAPGCKVMKNSEWLDVPCDIIIPAALEDVINKTNVDKVKASLIVEGANIPVTREADEFLFKKGVHVVPDFIANCGGIQYYDVVIYGHVPADPELVVRDLEKLCRGNTKKVFENAKETGRYERVAALDIFTPTIQDEPVIR